MIPNENNPRTSPYNSDRRSASQKRQSDIRPSEYPIITKAAYNAMLARESADVNEKMKWLAMGRIRLGHMKLAIDKALTLHNPNANKKGSDKSTTKVHNRLRAIQRDLDRLWLAYPLEVK